VLPEDLRIIWTNVHLKEKGGWLPNTQSLLSDTVVEPIYSSHTGLIFKVLLSVVFMNQVLSLW
jgi:hypothetical protein